MEPTSPMMSQVAPDNSPAMEARFKVRVGAPWPSRVSAAEKSPGMFSLRLPVVLREPSQPAEMEPLVQSVTLTERIPRLALISALSTRPA